MTSVAQTLVEGTALLHDSSASPRADALLLLGHALNREREWIVAHGDATPSREEVQAFERLSTRRSEGVPVAYLSALGTDTFSREMRAGWQREGLDVSLVLTDPTRLAGLYPIRTDAAGERTFYYWRERSTVATVVIRR